jgi:hypothetical protein
MVFLDLGYSLRTFGQGFFRWSQSLMQSDYKRVISEDNTDRFGGMTGIQFLKRAGGFCNLPGHRRGFRSHHLCHTKKVSFLSSQAKKKPTPQNPIEFRCVGLLD